MNPQLSYFDVYFIVLIIGLFILLVSTFRGLIQFLSATMHTTKRVLQRSVLLLVASVVVFSTLSAYAHAGFHFEPSANLDKPGDLFAVLDKAGCENFVAKVKATRVTVNEQYGEIRLRQEKVLELVKPYELDLRSSSYLYELITTLKQRKDEADKAYQGVYSHLTELITQPCTEEPLVMHNLLVASRSELALLHKSTFTFEATKNAFIAELTNTLSMYEK